MFPHVSHYNSHEDVNAAHDYVHVIHVHAYVSPKYEDSTCYLNGAASAGDRNRLAISALNAGSRE